MAIIERMKNRVASYIDESVAYKLIPTAGNLCFNSLFVSCSNTENLILCCIYKSRSTNSNDILDNLEMLLTSVKQNDQKMFYIC